MVEWTKKGLKMTLNYENNHECRVVWRNYNKVGSTMKVDYFKSEKDGDNFYVYPGELLYGVPEDGNEKAYTGDIGRICDERLPDDSLYMTFIWKTDSRVEYENMEVFIEFDT